MPCSSVIEDTLKRGSDVDVLRVRQVPRRRAQRPPGRAPAHGRADPDRRLEGPEVHRRRRAQEGRQRLTPLRRPAGRRSSPSASPRSCSGSIPDPARLVAGTAGRRCVAAHCRARHRRRRARLRRRQAAGRLLRAPRRRRLAGAAGDDRARAGRRPARARRRQARRHRRQRPALRAGVPRRRRATAVAGADALTVNPYLGADTPDAVRRRGARRGRGPVRARPHVEPRRRRPPGPRARRRRARVGARRAARRRARRRPAPASGLADVGAVVGATAPEHLARARELMPRAVFLLPGIGAQGGRVEDLAPAFAPGRAAGLVTVVALDRARARARRRRSRPAAARAEAERLRDAAWALA